VSEIATVAADGAGQEGKGKAGKGRVGKKSAFTQQQTMHIDIRSQTETFKKTPAQSRPNTPSRKEHSERNILAEAKRRGISPLEVAAEMMGMGSRSRSVERSD